MPIHRTGAGRRAVPDAAGPPARRPRLRRLLAAGTAALMALSGSALLAPTAYAQAPVGQGFTISPADLSFILKQIKIAESHSAALAAAGSGNTDPCLGLLGTGPNQVPTPLTSYGLRTVDGSCNNLQPGRATYAAAHQLFPRIATPAFVDAEPVPATLPVGPVGSPTSYKQKSGNVVDSSPRTVSNLIVDQTATNPAAVDVAANPARTQGADGVFACGAPGAPAPPACIPAGQTLFIPNVTTDVGLSPPFNSWFTLFGQFFDHGVDFTSKGGNGTVFVPLKADDPLIAGPDHIAGNADDLPAAQRFMVLTRAKDQPGADGVLGTADDRQDATNHDTPLVDQSQTYSSHPSHQVFLREYADNTAGRPVATGKLLQTPDGGQGTWALLKLQAAQKLGLALADTDVSNVPMIATDPYGKFVPGPARGLPQYVTATGLVEGDRAAPVAPPANVNRVDVAFLDDIAHHAVPDRNNGVQKTPDTDPGTGDDGNPATYDDEMLGAHFVAGDGRLNENIGLTAVHQIFHSEHDRLIDDIKNVLNTDTSPAGAAALAEWRLAAGADGWNGERLFQAARFITEMEYQHLVFEEFARKVQPAITPFTVYHDNIDPAVKAEFAHAVYRFGHSQLTDTVARINPDGTHADVPLLTAFLNPPLYQQGGLTPQQAAGSIVMGMSDQTGNEIDEFVTETLRNNLLGLPLDLATLNLTRARDAGVPPLNEVRRQINAATGDAALAPYGSWTDFALNLKHPQSAVNFVAAYGTHPTIVNATTLQAKRTAAALLVDPPLGADPATVPADAYDFLNATGAWANQETGINRVELWIGGLAERTNLFGGMLGSTFNYVFEQQLTDLQNADRLYYLARTPGMNLRVQLEGNSFAEMVMRNTTASSLKADSFARADCKFQLANLGTAGAIPDDPASECVEPALLIRMPDGTIRYKTSNTVDPPGINGQSVYNGTGAVDRIWGGLDNDTFLGNAGDDVIEGADGADVAIGGDGRDRITDSAGDDVPKGGPGNDAVDTGPGFDLGFGGDGNDLVSLGTNDDEGFGGPGNDLLLGGDGVDTLFGDSGDDWEQGGPGQELLQGDSGAPFFDDPNKPGHDVLIGQDGEEDYDAEGGDDVLIADAGIERNAGAAGYDWSTHERDTLPADSDLALPLVGQPLPGVVQRDRYQEVEGLSGGPLNDTLRGDSIVPLTVGGGGFSGCDVLDQAGIDRIAGLSAIVPAPTSPLQPVIDAAPASNCPLSGPVWGDGNVILGGAGSDLIEGRGANDVIDGDRYLHVRLSVRTNPADPATQIGTTDLLEQPYQAGNPKTLQQAIMDGTVDPGNVVAVRELVAPPAAGAVDTAVFSGPRADYDVTAGPGGSVVVAHARGTLADGTDRLFGVERLQFSDGVANAAVNTAASGVPTISDTTPTEGQPLTAVTTGITDPNGLGAFSFQWQSRTGAAAFANIPGATAATFTPAQAQVNQQLQVVVTYTDGAGFAERVVSAPTTVTGDLFVGTGVADTWTGTAGEDVAFGNGGNDSLSGVAGNDTLSGGTGTDTVLGGSGADTVQVAGGNDGSFDVVDGQADADRIVATGANAVIGLNTVASIESIESGGFAGVSVLGSGAVTTFTFNTVTLTGITAVDGGGGNDALSMPDSADTVLGGTGNDTIDGRGGDDTITGGAGTDTITTNVGNDRLVYQDGFGADTVNNFDALATGGQDLINVSAIGVTNANFGLRVSIAPRVGGGTTVTVRNLLLLTAGTIQLPNTAPADVNAADFLLAP
ncbi:peroxidase family protein [Pseudonocardia alni]|uniref:peroxidase family protein n=1 Tax=Pseudonocardia alni TaxID=33907 RepID=UPI00333362F5